MVTGLILAAGQGKRLGGVKPLLTHETATLIEMVIANYRASNLDNLILVLGHEARRVIQKIPLAGLKVVLNPPPVWECPRQSSVAWHISHTQRGHHDRHGRYAAGGTGDD